MDPVTTGYPCRHVFAAMKAMEIADLPVKSINQRWILREEAKYVSLDLYHPMPSDTVVCEATIMEEVKGEVLRQKKALSLHDTLKKASVFATANGLEEELASMISEFCRKPVTPRSEPMDLTKIQNPAFRRPKGRPSKRRSKGAFESKRKRKD